MEYFIDTNIFLRILAKEDEKSFRECYSFLKLVEIKQIKAVTSPLVLAEIDWVLENFYKYKKAEAVKALKSISKLRGLKIISDVNIFLAVEIYKNHSIKFIDALIASNSKIIKKEIMIVSYDKDFDKIKVIRKEPRELIKKIK
ncbi:PIN domain-containing protein [Candidatus Parcubacteria bacterium]|nr:PIN domain-containing protein [Candidatus Parcubacteria bacterium]